MSPGSAMLSPSQIISKLNSLCNYFFSFLPQFGAWSQSTDVWPETKPLPICGYIYQLKLILGLEIRAQDRLPANRGLFSSGIRQVGAKEVAH